ncbi:histidine kinase [Oscillospiraceae bacterium PP1C4]
MGGAEMNLRCLSTKIIIIVLLCWILPLILINAYSVFFYNNSIDSRINDYLSRKFRDCSDFSAERINSILSASKNASYDMTIEQTYAKYQEHNNWSDFHQHVEAYLDQRYYRKEFVMSAFFLTDDDSKIVIDAQNKISNQEFYLQRIHKKASEMARHIDTRAGFIIDENRIFIVRNMMKIVGQSKRFGVLVIQPSNQYVFLNLLQQSENPQAVVITISDTEGYVTIGNSATDSAKTLLADKLNKIEFQHVDIDNENIMLFNKIKLDDFTLGTAISLDKKLIYSKYDESRNILVILVLLMIPVIFAVLWFIHININKPINDLITATQKIEKGDFGFIIDQTNTKSFEFQHLTNSFNSMSNELQRLFDTVYKEQLALKDAKILALQSQINPHFLNNTLELMNWQARMAGDIAVSQMIEALSTLLDSRLDRSDKRLITLSEELRCVDAYLYITSMRFGKRISIEKDIDRNTLYYLVPRLILQPIVENAVIHGVEPVQGGTIQIHVSEESENVVLKVINKGKVVTDDDLRKINHILHGNEDGNQDKNESGSLGMKNVHQRIQLIYGSQFGLSIIRDGQNRTVSTIRLPKKNADSLNT